jgi:hypothetical protein
MTQFPDRHSVIGSSLIDMAVPRKAGRHDILVDRRFGRETVKAATPHQRNLVNQHIALRTQFSRIARLAQDAPCRIAAPVAKLGKRHFDKRKAPEMRYQETGILVRFEPDGGRV